MSAVSTTSTGFATDARRVFFIIYVHGAKTKGYIVNTIFEYSMELRQSTTT